MIVRPQKAIEALTAGLPKVSAQLELNKAAPQTALNHKLDLASLIRGLRRNGC